MEDPEQLNAIFSKHVINMDFIRMNLKGLLALNYGSLVVVVIGMKISGKSLS